MSDLTQQINLIKPGYYQFTMPDGYQLDVQMYAWGAGGGNGTGAAGGGGGFSYSNVAITAGTVVSVVVGTRGGDASGAVGGISGKGASVGYNGGLGANQGDPEDGDAGGSGGGGGATALIVGGQIGCVAAGGGGGGGYGDDGAGGATAGYPGGIFVPQVTSFYPATHPRYCGFLNTYGVWGPFPTSVSINFPVTGTYTFYFSVDNYGSVVLDGSTTLFSVTGEFNYQTYYTTTHVVSAGVHTLSINPVNIGGPASVGVQIIKPDTSELWNTRFLLTDTGLTSTTNGQNGTQGGAGGSGGGGGGYFGGETGAAFGDDQIGGQGGNGGEQFGDITLAGSGQTAGGASYKSAWHVPVSTGNAGYDGYAILVFTRKLSLSVKVSTGNVDIVLSGSLTATPGDFITQYFDNSSNIAASANLRVISSNTITVTPYNANVFTIGTGNIATASWGSNIHVNNVDANVYPVSVTEIANWTTVANVYYKSPVAGTLSNLVTQTYNTVSSGTSTSANSVKIPNGVHNVRATYPTPTGFVTTSFPVTPGETIDVNIGDFGENSSLVGQAGTLSIPAYQSDVFRFRGNNDDLDDTNFTVATPIPGAAFTGAGSQSTLTAGAAANGLYYAETNERYHGDLSATINMTPVRLDTVVQPIQTYISVYSGRYGPPSYASFLQQPDSSNNYVAIFRVYDPGGSEGYYDYTIGVQQQGWIQLTYDLAYAPDTWVPIPSLYYKDGSTWKLSTTNITIAPRKIE